MGLHHCFLRLTASISSGRSAVRASLMKMRLVEVGDIELEIHDLGHGDPVVLVQTALTADELAPLAALVATVAPTAQSPTTGAATWGAAVQGPGSVVRDAADCRDLIAVLRLDTVHVVGYSYSGAVAMQLAVDAADHVHTLTLIEPPPVHVPSSPEFRAANARLQDRAQRAGQGAEEFWAW